MYRPGWPTLALLACVSFTGCQAPHYRSETVLKPDGGSEIRDRREGTMANAEALGTELGRTLRDRAGLGFWLG